MSGVENHQRAKRWLALTPTRLKKSAALFRVAVSCTHSTNPLAAILERMQRKSGWTERSSRTSGGAYLLLVRRANIGRRSTFVTFVTFRIHIVVLRIHRRRRRRCRVGGEVDDAACRHEAAREERVVCRTNRPASVNAGREEEKRGLGSTALGERWHVGRGSLVHPCCKQPVSPAFRKRRLGARNWSWELEKLTHTQCQASRGTPFGDRRNHPKAEPAERTTRSAHQPTQRQRAQECAGQRPYGLYVGVIPLRDS